jgi:hypothetical protein
MLIDFSSRRRAPGKALHKKAEYVISKVSKSKGTEPRAVASGIITQLFKALVTNDFIDSTVA